MSFYNTRTDRTFFYLNFREDICDHDDREKINNIKDQIFATQRIHSVCN